MVRRQLGSELPRRISRVVQVERGDERVRTRRRSCANPKPAQQPQQSAAKKPRVAATIGSTAKLDMVAIKKHQVAKVAAAELETMESAYRDRAAERRSSAAAAAATAAATGSVKGKVYGGKIRTPGVPGYAPGSAPPSSSGGAGEGEDSYKASVQRVALERFKGYTVFLSDDSLIKLMTSLVALSPSIRSVHNSNVSEGNSRLLWPVLPLLL